MIGYLDEKLVDKINNWAGKMLSKGGKGILLKSVAQTIPNYAMAVFLLPLDLCKDMERAMCKFWWRRSAKKNKGIHWMSWERMCQPKIAGGLGFRNLHDFNIALLGKQAWRLISKPDCLMACLFKARYYPTGSFLSAKLGGSPSFVWMSVLEAQSIIKAGPFLEWDQAPQSIS